MRATAGLGIWIWVLAGSMACGLVREGGARTPWSREAWREMEPASGPKAILPQLTNGDFEQGTASPGMWVLVGQPEYREETLAGGGTNKYIRVSGSQDYRQEIAFPVGPWQTILATMEVRDEFAETQGLLAYSVKPTPTISSYFGRSARQEPMVAGQWERLYAAITRSAEDKSVLLIPTVRFDVTWVDVDNIAVYTEQPGNGRFEEEGGGELGNWLPGAGASIDRTAPLAGTGSLMLEPGGVAEQVVAHGPGEVEYFVTGRADGAFLLEEIRLTPGGTATDGSTSRTLTPDENGRFLLEMPRDDAAQAARLRLLNTGDTTARIDDVSRGFVSVRPRIIEPVTNSPSPAARLTAAWPGELAAAHAEIVDGGDVVRATLDDMTLEGGSAWTTFDGGTLEAGVYTVRFVLTDALGNAVVLERPLEIRRGPIYPTSPIAIQRPEFTALPWMFLVEFSDRDHFGTADEIEPWLRLAVEDGFNFLWIAAEEWQFPALREAVDRVGVPFMIYDPAYSTQFTQVHGNRTWDPWEAYGELSRFDVFLGSPWFQGIYLLDEPNVRGAVAMARVNDVMRIIEREGVYPPGYTFLNSKYPTDQIGLNLMAVFDYPIENQPRTTREMLEKHVTMMEPGATAAAQSGVPFWSGPQGFSFFPTWSFPTEEETRAMLGIGLALGARGYLLFYYNSFDPSPGFRGYDFEATRLVPEYRDFNRRAMALEGVLLSLETARSTPQSEGVVSRVALDGLMRPHLFVVNTDTEREVDILVETGAPARMTNLESGVPSDEGTTHTAALRAGDWGIYTFEGIGSPVRVTAAARATRQEPEAGVVELAVLDAGVALSRIGLAPDGKYLACIDNVGGAIYSLKPESMGTRVLARTFPTHKASAGFLPGGEVFFAARRWGALVHREEDGAFVPSLTWTRRSGGAREIVRNGAAVWLAQSYWGVDRLDFTGVDTAERRGHFEAEEFDLVNVFGPYEGGAILAMDDGRGLYRLTDSEDGIASEWLMDDRKGYLPARAFGLSRIAAPIAAGAVRIFDVDAGGNITRTTMIDDPELTHAVAADWVAEDTLAVADPRRGVRFYHVGPDGAWWSKALWEPVPPPFAILDMDALPEGIVAVSLTDGRVIIGDAQQVVEAGRQTGWMLY